MNQARENAEQEAALWLVRLAEAPADDELRAAFDAWRTASPLHDEVWTRTNRAYDLAGKVPPRHAERWRNTAAKRDAPAAVGAREPARAIKAAPRPARCRAAGVSFPRFAVTGVSATAAAVVALTILPGVLLNIDADYVTTTAEIRSIDLADGSEVHVAPKSAIAIDFSAGRRNVKLLAGAAFFDVAHDPKRPFTVQADDATVTVLGTAFEVEHIANGAAVAVQRGRVRVESVAAPTRRAENLAAGDRLEATNDAVKRGAVRLDAIAGWTRGEFVARDIPAGEIVDELRPYYRGTIIVQNRAFASRRVTGLYNLNNPEKTLADLAASHEARVFRVTPWITVVAGR